MTSLSAKRQRFVEAYLICWNASEAARQAGYAHADRQGHRLLKNVEIQETIKQRLNDCAMQADEALKRLADQARSNISEFVREASRNIFDDDGELVAVIQFFELNWEVIKQCGHLVKSISNTQYGPKIELYDGQHALELIGKHLRLFSDEPSVNVNVNFTADDLAAARTKAAAFEATLEAGGE